MRQTSGSMICPECGKLIGVGEQRCPFCGAWRPGLYGWTPVIQRLFGRGLDLIRLITLTCVVLYVVSLVLQPEAILQMNGLFSILSPGSRALFQLGATGNAVWNEGWWWTVITAIYLHGGILHIFFNLMSIRNIGPGVVDVYGPARAFVIFTVAGAVGFVVSNLVPPLVGLPAAELTIGASGSIFGLLAALLVYGHKRGGHVMTTQLWQWTIMMFLMGFFLSSINNWAHAGGFAGGWVTAQAMGFSERRESRMVQWLALGLLAITALGFVLSFIKVTGMLLAR
jgi:rhomboid protease GluP